MAGESSEQPKKRGRPSHSPTDNQKKNKRITDKKARQENRDIVVELTKAAPILKQLLEAFSSINGGDLLQTVRYIQWQQDEAGNSMPCIQEIKDAISEAVSKEVSPLRYDLQNVMQPNVNLQMASQALSCQYNQNPVQSDAFAEQQNNQFEVPFSLWDPFILDGIPWLLQLCEELGINIMCPTSTCDENGEKLDYKEVKEFFKNDANTKRQVHYLNFNGLQEELNKVVHNCFPSFLGPIIQKIKDAYGDITEKSKLSSCAAYPTLVMLYTTIKEMDEVISAKDVTISKLKVWRDAICDALQIDMEVKFAEQHLMKIAYAYFASKTIDQKMYAAKQWLEEMIKLHEDCQSKARFFDKPLNVGLFP